MGLFTRRADAEELRRLKADVASLNQRLESQGGTTDDLAHRLGSIDAANLHLTQQVGTIGDLTEHVARLADRPDPRTLVDRVDALATQLAQLDARVTAVSTELANQLSELGADLDGLAERPSGNGSEAHALTELRDGQVRLANEQTRYQIAFRDDLAQLAEQLRRPRA